MGGGRARRRQRRVGRRVGGGRGGTRTGRSGHLRRGIRSAESSRNRRARGGGHRRGGGPTGRTRSDRDSRHPAVLHRASPLDRAPDGRGPCRARTRARERAPGLGDHPTELARGGCRLGRPRRGVRTVDVRRRARSARLPGRDGSGRGTAALGIRAPLAADRFDSGGPASRGHRRADRVAHRHRGSECGVRRASVGHRRAGRRDQ